MNKVWGVADDLVYYELGKMVVREGRVTPLEIERAQRCADEMLEAFV
jgi:hypothetical protein